MNVDELAASTFETTVRGECWRQKISGEPLEFIEAVEKLMAQEGLPKWSLVSKKLKEKYGERIGANSVGRHYRGVCGCEQ